MEYYQVEVKNFSNLTLALTFYLVIIPMVRKTEFDASAEGKE